MPLRFWRPSLSERAANKFAASAAALALVAGLLTASLVFTRHADAAPQQHTNTVSVQTQSGVPHLEVFTINQADGLVYHKWSDDNGTTWSAWTVVPSPAFSGRFIGTPMVISDGVGRLTVFARDSLGEFSYKTFSNGAWTPATAWNALPGTDAPEFFGAVLFGSQPYYFASDPALTSWAPGRIDLLIYAHTSPSSPIGYLLHTWEENYTWTGQWEILGSNANFQGNPSATSWGPGRIDVFGRGPSNELEHKWYDSANGGWHNWENLGGVLTSSPTATSLGSGRLDIFVRGTDGHVWDKWFSSGGWSSWVDRGCCLAGDVVTPVAVTSPVPGSLSLFVLGTLHDLYRKPFTDGIGYGDWQYLDHAFDYTNIAVTSWTPPLPTVAVPNVISMDQDSATTVLTQAGLVVAVALDNSCRAQEGTVVLERPGPTLVVPVGSTVTLTVSSGYDRSGNLCFPNA